MRRVIISFVILLLLSRLTAGIVLAWPDQAPSKVIVSGQDISRQVEVNDPELLKGMKLGVVEDLAAGTVDPPAELGPGYQITRYFDDSSSYKDFRFGVLTYYPRPSPQRSYLFFEDGPDSQGDHTAYDRRWLYPTAQGELALAELLAKAKSNASNLPLVDTQRLDGGAESAAAQSFQFLLVTVLEAAIALATGLIALLVFRLYTGAK